MITAYADTVGDVVQDDGEPGATATVLWELPLATAGHVMGAGQIASPAGSDKTVFVFEARTSDRGLTGSCHGIDEAAATRVECLDVLALVDTANQVSVFGNATIDGVPATYRIDADDVAEPGAGHDRFVIQTSTGYSPAGALLKGNVQLK